MKNGRLSAVLVCALAGGLVSPADAGMTWRRSTDWVPGGLQGSTQNNPSNVGGVPAWRYEYTSTGSGIGSANPWYKEPSQLMTWDGFWYSTGLGVWSRGDNGNPPIMPGRLIYNAHSSVSDHAPIVRWLNPAGNNIPVNITGQLVLNWNGLNGIGRPVDVDVVIAKQDSLGNTTMLYQSTNSKPNPFPSVGDTVLIPINLPNIPLGTGDSIIISHRGRSGLSPLGAWVNLYDALTVSAVPAPGTAGLLAAAGMLAARRRRRA
ncbi:MAG: PEP-CTERM sorting domain-containing protein [Phycisphaerae bacterium]|nr:PEP-CTERM sorting domain-containing protein [Phycisphaerae bacterium]